MIAYCEKILNSFYVEEDIQSLIIYLFFYGGFFFYLR